MYEPEFNSNDFVRNSFQIIKLHPVAVRCTSEMRRCYELLSPQDRQTFSFVDRTDGFLPIGGEYSSSPRRPDLCERFNFWYSRRQEHADYQFSTTPFYEASAIYEKIVYEASAHILKLLGLALGSAPIVPSRAHSYTQLCVYRPTWQREDRQYLQDPHEDGHLISLIKPSCDGLLVEIEGRLTPISIADDEVIVISGSLLEVLTSNRVRALAHAVRRPDIPTPRYSQMYFVNPDPVEPIHLKNAQLSRKVQKLMAEKHIAFGNSPVFGVGE